MTRGHNGRTLRTREAILDLLEGSPGMTAAGLAAALGLQPNGVRKHLRSLVLDGSVGVERQVPVRPGRPAVRYRAGDARQQATALRHLAPLLVALLDGTDLDEPSVEEFGRSQAPLLASSPDGRTALLDMLTAMGFCPRETTGAKDLRAGGLQVVLGRCPFRAAVEAPGGTLVCALHRGISRGLVELTPSGNLSAFHVEPPGVGGCRIVAEGLRAPTSARAEDEVGVSPSRSPRELHAGMSRTPSPGEDPYDM